MKKNIFLNLILLISIVGFAQQKPQKFIYPLKAPATFDATRLVRIDSVFQRLVDNGTIPHAVTFVAHRGKVIHHKAYGWRNIESKTMCLKDDIFRMASQTKAITAVAVLTLFEEGKILLDDPVKKYIPEFANPQVLESFNEADSTFTTRAAKRDITIRHLLTHTAGIPYGGGNMRKIYDKSGIPVSPFYSLENKTLGDYIKTLAKCPLEHDPGEKFSYGMSTDVLGYLIEVVSGKSVDQYFREKIFEPLGMNETYFYLPENKQYRLVTLYEKSAAKPLIRNVRANNIYQTFPYSGAKTFFSTGAGLSGPVEDYAKFCQMILNGGEFNGHRILGRKTVEMMRKNAVGNMRGEIGFGLAFDDFRPEYSYRSIATEGALRWGGMFGTDYVIDPKEDLMLLFYINLEPNNTGTDFKVLFHNLVYQALK
ncbi:MAG: serine hydrolase domain-containing protein [Paludibacter sp.]|nr:serine hydrolase domain-containing protein [Paludibacter sp.]